MSDADTGDVYNYNLQLGPFHTYRIFKTSAATGKTEILASLSGNGIKGAYIHSFFKSEDFIILCIWNARIQGTGVNILMQGNLLDGLAPFDPSQPARWYVIDRKHGRGLVAEFESRACFCFHTVNAWQETRADGKVNIICEYVEYESLDILYALYYANMMSNRESAITFKSEKGQTCMPRLAQYRLSGIEVKTLQKKQGMKIPQAELILSMPKAQSGELPTINPKFEGKQNRYVYGITNRGYSTFLDGICKTDTLKKTALYWENKDGHTPGEAIFVPNPAGTEEDDGVLLSVVLDGHTGKSYLLCLDARDMKELGRAECDWVIGCGFHGIHVGY